MKFGFSFYHIWFRSLLWGMWRQFHRFMGMIIAKFVCYNTRTGNVMMFNSAECVDKCLCRPQRVPLRESWHSSRCSLRTPAVHYIVCWQPSTLVSIYSRHVACCLRLLLRTVSWTIIEWVSWDIFLVAALAGLWWANWCRQCYCVPEGGILDEAPVGELNSDLLAPCQGICGAMNCCCGQGEEDDHEKKWELLSNI